MRFLFTMLILAATPAFSEIWLPLTADGIRDALTDRHLDYGGATQDFRASGRTLYNAGHDSWGTWDVRGDQYCSQWPPNSAWACFDVDVNVSGDRIRFQGRGNDVTVGAYTK